MPMTPTTMGPVKPSRSRQRLVHLLALATLLFFGGVGLLLIGTVQQRDPIQVIVGVADPFRQVVTGLVVGLLVALGAWVIIRAPFMGRIRQRYAGMIGPLVRHRWQRVWLSICAGVGEEIFFRGAVQYWLGIPVTAVVFVAIHGYLDPRDWRIGLYGIYMTLAMILIGQLAARYGLIAPMLAHTVIDIILLERLHATWRHRTSDQS